MSSSNWVFKCLLIFIINAWWVKLLVLAVDAVVPGERWELEGERVSSRKNASVQNHWPVKLKLKESSALSEQEEEEVTMLQLSFCERENIWHITPGEIAVAGVSFNRGDTCQGCRVLYLPSHPRVVSTNTCSHAGEVTTGRLRRVFGVWCRLSLIMREAYVANLTVHLKRKENLFKVKNELQAK